MAPKKTPLKTSSDTQPELPQSFEAAIEELQTIVAAIEQQDLPLEQALSAYERGIALSKYCSDKLDTAEQHIQVLQQGRMESLNPAEVDDGSSDEWAD